MLNVNPDELNRIALSVERPRTIDRIREALDAAGFWPQELYGFALIHTKNQIIRQAFEGSKAGWSDALPEWVSIKARDAQQQPLFVWEPEESLNENQTQQKLEYHWKLAMSHIKKAAYYEEKLRRMTNQPMLPFGEEAQ